MKRNELRREIKRLEDRLEELEPEIVELVAVAPAGPDQMLIAGYTADGRWVSRME